MMIHAATTGHRNRTAKRPMAAKTVLTRCS
jgi:hypothetical protein